MKNKKMNRILATTMATVMLIMPLATTTHAIGTYGEEELDIINSIDENITEELKVQMEKDNAYAEEIASQTRTKRAAGYQVAKAIAKAWNALPYKVKVKIAAYGGLKTFMNILNNMTGAVENMVYKTCTKMGMNSTVAWWVTQAVLLVL